MCLPVIYALMRGVRLYSFGAIAVFVFLSWLIVQSDEQEDNFSEEVKISLREVGNQLLLSSQDSTSLILPIVELSKSKFKISFQNNHSFEPSTLVSAMKEAFEKSGLPEHYIVEVIECTDQEVAYSYKMTSDEQTTIIPCAGRYLPIDCYTIEVKFTSSQTAISSQLLLYVLGFMMLIFLGFLLGRRKQAESSAGAENKGEEDNIGYAKLGNFQFYPQQNKLVAASVEIGLSRKECELLAIFVANPNQIIKRDELTKKVWEDHGVIVGRSLDTYISKLRKKLQTDNSIKLTNVHGVGYKLELRA